MRDSLNWKHVIVIAGSYVATLIGSGLATGQEILQFFSYYGLGGILVSAIVMVLYALLAVECLERGRLVQPRESMKMFQFYAGKYVGTFFEWFTLLFLFGVTVIMIAGAGDTLAEYYGLNRYIGRVLIAITMYATVSLGLMRLANIIGNIGPVIILFMLVVAGITLVHAGWDGVVAGSHFMETAKVDRPVANSFIAGFNYASFNVIVVVGYLAGLGRDYREKRTNIVAGLLGGVVLAFAIGMMYLAILSHAPETYDKAIPTLVLAHSISPLLGKLFSVILLLGIYTTAVTLTWQVADRFTPDGTPRFKWTALIVSLLAFVCGFAPFGKLVSTIYPFTGYVGIIMILLMLVSFVRLRLKNESGADRMRQLEEELHVH